MNRFCWFLSILVVVLGMVMEFSQSIAYSNPDSHSKNKYTGAASSQRTRDCLIGECYDDDYQIGFVSEGTMKARVLAQNTAKYISYSALKKDNIPCKRKGQSYYNCNEMGKVNPYNRGCTAITRCKRDTD